jgi:hypothetical protein
LKSRRRDAAAAPKDSNKASYERTKKRESVAEIV